MFVIRKITRTIKSLNSKEVGVQVQDILELSELSEETENMLTEEQTDCLKNMVRLNQT